MSDVVYKYPVPLAIPLEDEFSLMLPVASQILTVQTQLTEGREKPFVWVKHTNNTTKIVSWKFRLAGTGHLIDEPKAPAHAQGRPEDVSGPFIPWERRKWHYVGTFQLQGGRLVFHLFVEIGPQQVNSP